MLAVPTRTWFQTVRPQLFTRAASTRVPRGLSNILQKNSDDVVITFGKRTAVGRAKKGQWKDTTVDELVYALFKVCHNFFFLSSFFLTNALLRLLLRRLSSTQIKSMIYVLVGTLPPSHGSVMPPCLRKTR